MLPKSLITGGGGCEKFNYRGGGHPKSLSTVGEAPKKFNYRGGGAQKFPNPPPLFLNGIAPM